MYGEFHENFEKYDEITALKASKISPLEPDEQELAETFYIKFERFVTVKVGSNQIVKDVKCSKAVFDSFDLGESLIVICYKDGTKTGLKI